MACKAGTSTGVTRLLDLFIWLAAADTISSMPAGKAAVQPSARCQHSSQGLLLPDCQLMRVVIRLQNNSPFLHSCIVHAVLPNYLPARCMEDDTRQQECPTCGGLAAAWQLHPTRRRAAPRGWLCPGRPQCIRSAPSPSGGAPPTARVRAAPGSGPWAPAGGGRSQAFSLLASRCLRANISDSTCSWPLLL